MTLSPTIVPNIVLGLPERLPSRPGEKTKALSLPGSGVALSLASLLQQTDKFILVLVEDPAAAEQLTQELSFFMSTAPDRPHLPILQLPDWETLPYDPFSPHREIVSDRLSALYRLTTLEKGILIAPIMAAMQRIVPKHYLLQRAFFLKVSCITTTALTLCTRSSIT